jgi:hypothetical protein
MRDVERIIGLIRTAYPDVQTRQLEVVHPGQDDDGLWFFSQPRSPFEVQIESSNGMCPFLIETDETGQRFTAGSVNETIQILSQLLHLAKIGEGSSPGD